MNLREARQVICLLVIIYLLTQIWGCGRRIGGTADVIASSQRVKLFPSTSIRATLHTYALEFGVNYLIAYPALSIAILGKKLCRNSPRQMTSAVGIEVAFDALEISQTLIQKLGISMIFLF